MTTDRIHDLLDRLNTIQGQTDLDLVVFLFRHPNALLTIQFLALAIGHRRDRVEESLDRLAATGLVERAKSRSLETQRFVFRPTAQDSVMALLQMASSRPGRLALLEALQQRTTTPPHERKA